MGAESATIITTEEPQKSALAAHSSAGGQSFLHKGLHVSFKDVTYTVINSQNKKEKLALLTGVSGFFKPGQMAALMGPSGSGKTTLLDIFVGRKTVGKLKGEIKFGANAPTRTFLRRFTGYVEQFDTLLAMLTVEEMLMYTADLKRPVTESAEKKAFDVDILLGKLNLVGCRNARIGNPQAKGIPGGQAKRVNIGIALITNPRVLFLDEPTTGLDSFTANEVMTVVKGLALSGLTVCCTIHTPTPVTFRLFDRLMVLLRGRVVYFGPSGRTAIDYFLTEVPGVIPLQERESEADWIVDAVVSADRQGRAGAFAEAYAASHAAQVARADMEEQFAFVATLKEKAVLEFRAGKDTVTPFFWAMKTLLRYRTSRNYKDSGWLAARIADKIVVVFLMSTLYWGIGDNLESGNLINIIAILFMWAIMAGAGAASYVPAMILERGLFVRERSDGVYRVITYLSYKFLEEFGMVVLISLFFTTILWFTIQLQGSFVLFWLVYLVSLSIGIVLAWTIAGLCPNIVAANAAVPGYMVIMLFFIGFLIVPDAIPAYYKWYSYTLFGRWALNAMVANQFNGDRNVDIYPGVPVLEYYSLNGYQAWTYLGIEAAFFPLFFVLCFLVLTFKRHVKR